MAHNLHFNPLRNEHSFFTIQEKAWHGLGKVIEHYPNSEMALRYAGLDFEVLKRPNRHLLDDGTVVTSSDSFFTYREDTGEILGSKLGRDYEVVQNTDAFAFFDSIVGGDGILYETAGALGKGERVFITAKLPGYIMVQNRDLIEKYLFLTTSHDGSGAITAAFTPVRIVCNNTLNMALRNCESRITIRHTRDARNRLENAHRVLGISNRLADQLEMVFNDWSRIRIRDAEVLRLIELAMTPPRETLSSINEKTSDEFSAYHRRVCDTVFEYAMTAPSQQMDTVRGTLFGAYNGITGYFQNVRNYRSAEDKLNSLLYSGLGEQRCRKAFRLCEGFASNGCLIP
jgi:phage/plasmid-like protein (TIGR03299 family)